MSAEPQQDGGCDCPSQAKGQDMAKDGPKGPIVLLFLGLIRLYQLSLSKLIRLLLGNVCRFHPSCSAYAYECIRMHGAWHGGLLSAKRLSKCHPLHPGGYDPPPKHLPGKGAADRAEAATAGSPPTPSPHGLPTDSPTNSDEVAPTSD